MQSWKEFEATWTLTPWEVRTSVVGVSIEVYAGRGGMGKGPGIFVTPQNWIERLLGITLDAKLEKAIRKVRKDVEILEVLRLRENGLREYLKGREGP